MARLNIKNSLRLAVMAQSSGYNAALLSASIGLSQRQLNRYTQELFQKSLHQWLRKRRMDAAAELLKTQPCVKTVAFELGFKQMSHFSRMFKSHHGVPPSSYQEQINYCGDHLAMHFVPENPGLDHNPS